MADVKLSIVSPLGTTLPLVTGAAQAGAFRVMSGTSGLGLAAPSASMTDSAGDGRRVGNVRVASRTMTLKIDVTGTSRADTEAKLDQLADAISYVDGKPLPRLRATYADGKAREIEFLHVGGGGDGLTDDGEKSATWILTLDAPDPYWTAVEYASFVVQQSATSGGFLESLPNAYLLPSDAFGDIAVTNPGRVESWLDWELHGPFTQVTAQTDRGGWTFDGDVAEGETVYLRKTAAGIEVVDDEGVNRFAQVHDVPQFFRIPAGSSRLTVAVLGATPSTKAIGRFRPRYRLVF